MSVGEFTASNIAVDQDKKDEDAKKKGNIDYSKIEAAVSSNKELASKAKHWTLDPSKRLSRPGLQSSMGKSLSGKGCRFQVSEKWLGSRDSR